MKITIEYKTVENDDLKSFILSPESYFDVLEENENIEDDGVPRYNEPKKYLIEYDNSIHLEDVEYTIETIKGSLKSDRRIKTIYFGNGQSIVIHRKDKDGYELIIQSYRIAQNCIHTSRIERNDNSSDWKVTSSTGFNYEIEHEGEEKWYSPLKGEYLKKIIEVST